MSEPKPSWWPTCPYLECMFPMKSERYEEIVPDPDVRTALSGMLGREFWDIASEAIWEAFCRAERLTMSEQSGVELRLAVAKVLGQTEPPGFQEYEWNPNGDETYQVRVYTAGRGYEFVQWPLPYDTDVNLALEAWARAPGNSDYDLEITRYGDGSATVTIHRPTIDQYPTVEQGGDIPSAICRALVVWHGSKVDHEKG